MGIFCVFCDMRKIRKCVFLGEKAENDDRVRKNHPWVLKILKTTRKCKKKEMLAE